MSRKNRKNPDAMLPPPVRRARALERALMLMNQGKFDEAETILRKEVPNPSKDADALRMRGSIAERQQRPREAMDFAERSLKIRRDPNTLLLIGQLQARNGDVEGAMDQCREALALEPNHLPATFMLISACLENQRIDEAAKLLAPLLGRHKDIPELDRRIQVMHGQLQMEQDQSEEACRIFDEVLEQADIHPRERRSILFLKTRAGVRSDKHDEAFSAATSAQSIARPMFVPRRSAEMIDAMLEVWSRDNMQNFPLCDNTTEEPVFISGMPRSGVFLMNRILASHPAIASTREDTSIEKFSARISEEADINLPPPQCFGRIQAPQWNAAAENYLRTCAASNPDGAIRTLNCFMGNNRLVGLISRLFPKARIIHVVRDPRDVAISTYMSGYNGKTHPWTTRLDWIVDAWMNSQRLMAHWSEHLDLPMLEVRYEHLVEKPEEEVRRILDFLGVEWDADCLEFHQNHPPSQPLGKEHLGQPLNSATIGRHVPYAEHFKSIEFPEY